MVADWVSFNVIDTEKRDWARGWSALKRYVERVGNARVPYGHREGATPLGQWVAEQRRAYAAGEMSGQRAQRLERLGMVWSVADERFQENLQAAKAYYAEHWTLCVPRPATALDRPVGQWLSNLRRPGALDGHPSGRPPWRPSTRIGAPTGRPPGNATTPHYASWCAKRARPTCCPASPSTAWTSQVAGPATQGGGLGHSGGRSARAPGGHRRRARVTGAGSIRQALQHGCEHLRARHCRPRAVRGAHRHCRAHVEVLPDGTGVRLGVFLSNSKSRRARLTATSWQRSPHSDSNGRRRP
ncbi:helicase associated domain-containing protein [Streptomyces sp. NPDC015220]|uniref:helicase associated domain-containing protein n=1 Tax=Streptomyces sp. NPDC015220 TaxID=3364947 RepID=UPI0036F77590